MAEYIHEVSPEMEKLFSYRNGFQTKIVRCKDCEYFDYSYGCLTDRGDCHANDPNGFCAWGVRKDGK